MRGRSVACAAWTSASAGVGQRWPRPPAGSASRSAQALAAEGARVALCGRTTEKLDAAVRRSPTPEATRSASRPTCRRRRAARRFVEDAIAALGGVDILVPNAGGPPPGGFGSTDLEQYGPALEQNLLSTVAMCAAAVPAMREQGWGRVVAITSVSVRQPIEGLILSNTARAGATGFLKTLALEVAADGVTVNSVQPGSHDTERLRSIHGGDLTGRRPCGARGDRRAGRGLRLRWSRSSAPSTPASSPAPPCRSTAAPTEGSSSAAPRRRVPLEGRHVERAGRRDRWPRSRALPGQIPELRAYDVGADEGLVPGNGDFAVVADVDDATGGRPTGTTPRTAR